MPLLALSIWPFIAMIFFYKLPPARALFASVLTGYLLLPERFSVDLPSLPPVDKGFVLTLGMLLGAFFFAGSRAVARKTSVVPDERLNLSPRVGIVLGLAILLLFLGPIFTIRDNGYPILVDTTLLNALRPWDFVSMTFNTCLFVVPFLLGRRYLATADTHRMILQMLVIAGLCYSLLILFEIRMSPQLNKWIYGYYQHSFAQHVRGDGFRPMVFLRHGLWVGFFVFTVIIAAFALWRLPGQSNNGRYLLAGLWMLGVLLISNNLGAVMITALVTGMLFLPRRWQIRAVFSIAMVFVLYPAARQADLVPVDTVAALASNISEARARSFQFRLGNEDQLLDRALEKPFFGWGGWGRSRVYNDFGKDISVTDGLWIIIIGRLGWLGYICFFALLTVPIFFLAHVARRKEIPAETMALALIMAGNLIYIVPNSTVNPMGWLMAGALAGFVQFDWRAAQKSRDEIRPDRLGRGPRYARFSGLHPSRGRSVRHKPHSRPTSTP